jgi:hypothetical protein
MGIRLSFLLIGAILAGVGLFWVLGTAIASFGLFQTFASIVVTAALGLFYRMGYSDGKHACYLHAKPGETTTPRPNPQRREPQI